MSTLPHHVHSIYSGLEDTDLGTRIILLQQINDGLTNHISKLETDIKRLMSEIINMKKTQDNLTTNISELYNTAKAEIDRKNRTIADLRAQLDDVILRRGNRHLPPKLANTLTDKKRSHNGTSDSSDNKRFKSEFDTEPSKHQNMHEYNQSSDTRTFDGAENELKRKTTQQYDKIDSFNSNVQDYSNSRKSKHGDEKYNVYQSRYSSDRKERCSNERGDGRKHEENRSSSYYAGKPRYSNQNRVENSGRRNRSRSPQRDGPRVRNRSIERNRNYRNNERSRSNGGSRRRSRSYDKITKSYKHSERDKNVRKSSSMDRKENVPNITERDEQDESKNTESENQVVEITEKTETLENDDDKQNYPSMPKEELSQIKQTINGENSNDTVKENLTNSNVESKRIVHEREEGELSDSILSLDGRLTTSSAAIDDKLKDDILTKNETLNCSSLNSTNESNTSITNVSRVKLKRRRCIIQMND